MGTEEPVDHGELRITSVGSIIDGGHVPMGLDALERFYRNNADDGVRPRPHEMMIKAREDAGLFVVERVATEEIVAAGGVFEFSDDAAAPGRVMFEAGADRSILGGLGLQRVLAYVRALHWYLTLGAEGLYCAIAPPDSASLANLEKVGFVPEDPDPVLFAARARAFGVEPSLDGKVHLRLPESRIAETVAGMLRAFAVDPGHFDGSPGPVVLRGRKARATLRLEVPVLRFEGLGDLLARLLKRKPGN